MVTLSVDIDDLPGDKHVAHLHVKALGTFNSPRNLIVTLPLGAVMPVPTECGAVKSQSQSA